MLNVISVEAKNFLSYGDVWTKLDLLTGINLITGLDKTKKRSNGAGKTSLMEIIIFALFGQVSKGLKQSQIINWKNKKKCEVKITIEIKGQKYLFNRGLKPNFFKVSKMNEKGEWDDYPINSSIKDFQGEIEDQIIKMDFKTFNSLIYSNPNNSISLLDTPKAQKRAFLEKQFNLTEFSILNKLNNKILREIEDDIKFNDKDQEKFLENINEYNENILSIQNEIGDIDFDSLNEKYKELLKDLEKYKGIDIDKLEKGKLTLNKAKEKLKLDKQKLVDVEFNKNQLKNDIITIITTIKSLKKQRDDIGDLSEKLEQLKVVKKEIDKINKRIIAFGDVEERLQAKKDAIPEIEKTQKTIDKTLIEHEMTIKQLNDKINGFKNNITNVSDMVECPTCFQEVDYESIKVKFTKEIELYQAKVDSEIDVKDIVKKSLIDINKDIKKIKEDIISFEDMLRDKQNLEKKLLKLVNKKTELESYSSLQEKLNEINNEIKELSDYKDKQENLEGLVKEEKDIKTIIVTRENNISDYEIAIDNIQKNLDKKKEIEHSIDTIKNEITYKKEEVKKLKIRETEYQEKVKINKDKISKFVLAKETLVDDKEHHKYIKLMLKDENIKQFAISHMVPIIEKQVNYYLGEAGFGFYLKLDAWLNAEIKGPGISDCSFASMSGGERKSIDLALKFAIMDMSIARNPDFPNFLILDELLDSSVDSYGIQQLMEVVKVKQLKHNLKVFIISHRQEMDELEPDNRYLVVKENGFSTIIIE